jgi:predicted Na+-dependent transporter
LLGGAVASTVSSGTVPVLLAGATSASVTSVVADVMLSNTPSLKGADMTSCAATNFWDVIGQLIEMGGWLLVLVVLIPMVLGWILPGPLERRKKKK